MSFLLLLLFHGAYPSSPRKIKEALLQQTSILIVHMTEVHAVYLSL